MKSSFELAMERLNKSAPTVKLTAGQRKALAELDTVYTARLAEREIAFQADILKAEAAGDEEGRAKFREQLATDRRKLLAELEEKKEKVRQGKG